MLCATAQAQDIRFIRVPQPVDFHPAIQSLKISQLSAITSLTNDDLLVVVNDPGGTPATNKITYANFKTSIFASPTIVTPTIASFANAQHDHSNAANGGLIASSGANAALSNLASVAINTDLLPASTQSLGSAAKPFLASFTGNTTQYESASQSAGLITHAGLGSATNIGFTFTPKGSGNFTLTTGSVVVPAGTVSIPGISFSSISNAGLYTDAPGGNPRLIFSVGGSLNTLSVGGLDLQIKVGANSGLVWTATNNDATAAKDTGVTRIAAGVIGAGTGASAARDGWMVDAGASRVATQFDKTSDTTLANVTGLTVTVKAGRTYSFTAILYTTSNVAGGVKAAIAGTATATAIIYEAETASAGITGAVGTSRATALGTAVGDVTAVTVAKIMITGTITVNAAGTLTVQFAQNASNGTASSVLVGSSFIVIDNP